MSSHSQGFTFVELVLYMGLFLGFLVVLTDLFVTTLDLQLEAATTSAVQQDGRYILARTFYDVARSDSVVQPASLGQITTDMVLTIGGTNWIYGLTGDNLTVTGPSGTYQLNSADSRVSGFRAQRIGDGGGKPTIQLVFTETSAANRPNGPEVAAYQTTIGLR